MFLEAYQHLPSFPLPSSSSIMSLHIHVALPSRLVKALAFAESKFALSGGTHDHILLHKHASSSFTDTASLAMPTKGTQLSIKQPCTAAQKKLNNLKNDIKQKCTM